MKKLTSLLIVLTASLLFFSMKMQTSDPNCGIVVDGVLVDSITCWSFKDLSIVSPVKPEWKKYDKIVVGIKLYNSDGKEEEICKDAVTNYEISYDLLKQDINDGQLLNAKYWVWTVFPKDKEVINEVGGKKTIDFSKHAGKSRLISAIKFGSAPKTDYDFSAHYEVTLLGYYQIGTEEAYNGTSYVRVPKYGNIEILWESKKVPIKRQNCVFRDYMGDKAYNKWLKKHPGSNEIDMSQPCTLVGKKVEIKTESYKQNFFLVKK